MTASLQSKTVFTVTDDCAGCGACLLTCPERAIHPAPEGHHVPLVILEDLCTACAGCAEVCPVAACVEVPLTVLSKAG